MSLFRDRAAAGRVTARALADLAGRGDVIVLGLARGGVPIAAEVAEGLGAPLDVFLVRKLGTPGHEELAMGAIASGGVRVMNPSVVDGLGISERDVEQVAAREQMELERRERAYRGDRPPPDLRARVVVLCDDGLATGASMRAAVRAVRQRSPAAVVVAVPVGATETCAELEREVDRLVCVERPSPFLGVGAWYDDFSQTTDEEVRALLERAASRSEPPGGGDRGGR